MAVRLNLKALKIEDRITPSDRHSGIWIEAGTALCFTLGGLVGLLWLFFGVIMPEWRLLEEFQRTECSVVNTRIVPSKSTKLFRPEVQIEYQLVNPQDKKITEYKIWTYDFNTLQNGGFVYQKSDAEDLLRPFQPQKRFICWYDPHTPSRAVLFCCWTWTNIFLLIVPLSLVLIGLGPLIHLFIHHGGHSREKTVHFSQSAISPSAENNTISPENASESETDIEEQTCPTLPSIQTIVDSPGVKLKYRLPLDNSPLWGMGVLLALCAAWGILSLLFASVAVGKFLDNRPDWVLSGFIFPFVLIWVGLIAYFLHNLQRTTAVAPTLLEMDEVPLYPGQSAQVLLIQFGAHQFKYLTVNLVCEEEVVFTYGTDSREEKTTVYKSTLFSQSDFMVLPEDNFEKQMELTIPENAMHSFEAAHNRVLWRLSVEGEVEGQAPFVRRFCLVVTPRKQVIL